MIKSIKGENLSYLRLKQISNGNLLWWLSK